MMNLLITLLIACALGCSPASIDVVVGEGEGDVDSGEGEGDIGEGEGEGDIGEVEVVAIYWIQRFRICIDNDRCASVV